MTTTTKRRIFFVLKKKWQSEKKSFLPFFIHFVFVSCFDTLTFLCPLWLFTNQRERRDVFIHTHTRTEEERLLRELLQREREREKKKEHGEERGTTLCFVSIQQKRKSKEDFCFKRDDEERSFFFNLLVPGGTLVLRGWRCRASRTTTTTTTRSSLQRERVRQFAS